MAALPASIGDNPMKAAPRVWTGRVLSARFGVYLGVIMWAGLWLRDAPLRALLPLRQGNLQ